MTSLDLNYDIYQHIIRAVDDTSTASTRDKLCLQTLLSCCLVNHLWRRLAQPILNQTIIVESEDDLKRRIAARLNDPHLTSLRNIVIRNTWQHRLYVDIETVLGSLPSPHLLRCFVGLEGIELPGNSDAQHREQVGAQRVIPLPLNVDLSGLREAVIGLVGTGPCWVPFLRVVPNLQYLTFYQSGWWGHSPYAGSPTYLPVEPPPFRLKRLEILRSHIKEEPLRWLLSGGSSETLTSLKSSHPQAEWDTFLNLSKMRAEGFLPNVQHVEILLSDSHPTKFYDENVSTPLGLWSGVKTVCIYGFDSKAMAALVHGIAQLDPIPKVELIVGDMRMVELKGLFRLRKGKFQPGTELRLVTQRAARPGLPSSYERLDTEAMEYWRNVEWEAAQVAEKYGVRLEIARRPIYEV